MIINRPNTLAVTVLALAITAQSQAQDLVLEEVIVTAQKRAQTLFDTPMTVSVVTGEQIAEFGNFSFEDFNNLTSGLAISGNNFDTDIATRGLGADLNAAITPRVSVYLDGTFVNQQRGLFSGIYDVSQFELLRGPQGTLYGQASPAGAITIQTANPNLGEIAGYVRQSFTDQAGSNTQFGLSLPIIRDQLAVRFSGLYDTNEASAAENLTLEKDLEKETRAFRAVVLWEPAANFDLRLSYHEIEDEFDIDPVVQGNGLEFDDRKAVADFDSRMRGETDYLILESNYTFSNDWVLTFVASDQDNRIPRYWDGDASEVQARSQFVDSNVYDTQVYELRLASQGNDFWDWTAGLFYQDSYGETTVAADTWTAVGPAFTVFADVDSTAITGNELMAVFTHNTLHVSDRGTLTVGLRYSDVDRENRQPFSQTYYLVNPDGSNGPVLGELEIDGVAQQYWETSEDAITGTLKYQHRLTDDLMLYGSYDRGWRGGSANISARPAPEDFGAFDAEDSDNIELGFKWDVLNGRGLLNFAAYYQVYSDFQFQAASVEYRDGDGRISLADPVVNVDEAESYGFDSDFTILLSENWTLRAALSYNKAELTDADAVPCTTGEQLPQELFYYDTCDFTGERAGEEAEWSGNLASEYSTTIGRGAMEWYLRGLLNAESEFYSQSERKDLDGYAMLDLFLGLRSSVTSWDVNLWVKNVTDESALLKSLMQPQIPDYDTGIQVDNPYIWVRRQLNPRTIGITASYNF